MNEEKIKEHEEKFPILRFFRYKHLPPRLQYICQMFYETGHLLVLRLPDGECARAERQVALRKLLEAKDAAVRAAL